MKKQNSRNLDTLFAIEFGQLLENHLLVRSNRDELKGILCSSLGLKNENQLAQVFAGYDTPSTANIFELIRTLNDQEFTDRFLNLQTTLMGVSKDDINVARKANKIVPKVLSEPPIPRSEPSWDRENTNGVCSDRVSIEDSTTADYPIIAEDPDSEFGEIDFNFLDE